MSSHSSNRAVLPFLDGIRGLSALYVTLHHAAIMIPPGELGRGALRWIPGLYMGHAAVSVFIVLSGYCLMLPVVRSTDGWMRGGVVDYLGRRARRILPPYYAALGVCLLLAAVVPDLRHRGGTAWDLALPVFRGDVVLSHVLLVHNLRMKWFYRIDPPMWSVATEWQIYFVFPALVWIWRRLGIAPAVALGFLLASGLASIPLLLGGDPGRWAVRQACPWYLGLFALGMAAAVVGFSDDPRARWSRRHVPWGVLTATFGTLSLVRQVRYGDELFANDTIMGLATACLLVFCELHDRAGSPGAGPPVLGIVKARWAVALGSFSYSLYLLNYPLLSLGHLVVRRWVTSPEARLAVSLLAAVPLTIALAYLFHLAFERPVARRAAPGAAPRLGSLRHPAHEGGGCHGLGAPEPRVGTPR